jgi:hypothetical protein
MPRFTLTEVAGGSITSDANTGLEWSHTLLGRGVNQAIAQGLIDQINADTFGGHNDWRLPTVEELFVIADRSKFPPAADADGFPDMKSDWYWTSTPCTGGAGWAWGVGFGYGVSHWLNPSYYAFVRAVRGPAP